MRLFPLALSLLLTLFALRSVVAAELFYLGQKIPDIQRPWSSGDYQQLLIALQKVDTSQNNALPRRRGEFTGPIYQRMVSQENFRPQLNIYAPLELRQNEARETLLQLKELMRLYFDFSATRQPYGAEALGLMSHALHQQAILFTLTVEFWMTLSADEQRNPVRLQGLHEAKDAAGMLTTSALDYLDLGKQFGQDDLVIYAAELGRLLPELFVHLAAETREELMARIAELTREHPHPEVRSNLAELHPVLITIQRDMSQRNASRG